MENYNKKYTKIENKFERENGYIRSWEYWAQSPLSTKIDELLQKSNLNKSYLITKNV